MTPEEAIKTIQVAVAEVEWNYPLDYAIAFETAINALETVNLQKAEIEDLQMDKEQLKRAVINANMKGEHLQAENKRLLTEFLRFKEEIAKPYLLINCDDKSVEVLRELLKKQKVISVPYNKATVEFLDKASIRAEAVREFAERLKETKFKHDNDYIVYAENIDVLVKEMAGDKE